MGRCMSEFKVELIDTSSWTEFGDFFDRPMSKSMYYIWNEPLNESDWFQVSNPVGFISLVSENKDKAIAELRSELLKLKQSPAVIKAYLAKPSVLETHQSLSTGNSNWIAFCFLHGYTHEGFRVEYPDLPPYPIFRPLDKENLERFITCAATEGEIGKNVE
jgi:hypothetical protein